MARPTRTRLIVTGELVTESAIHIGGLGAGVGTDMPFAQDGFGRYYIPGTSLAGPIRAWWEAVFGRDDAARWLGSQNQASLIELRDAALGATVNVPFDMRHGVGIDRVRGVAADRIKFDRAVLPKGARLPLVMTADATEQAKGELVDRLRTLLRDLRDGRILFGAGKTGGLGRIRLVEGGAGGVTEYDLATPTGILALARDGAADKKDFARFLGSGFTRPQPDAAEVRIAIQWEPDGAVMQKAPHEGNDVDIVPLTIAADTGGKVQLVLQGTGVKGALRAQAERIVRTCLGRDANGEDFAAQLNVPLVTDIFGAPSRRDPAGQTIKGSQGALVVDDVRSTMSLNLKELLDAETGSGAAAAALAPQDHIAIDRFLGGAADGSLFSVLTPVSTFAWEPIRLALRFDWLRAKEAAVLALICLLLDDLARGRIAFGFGAARDKGSVIVRRISVSADGKMSPDLKTIVDALCALNGWRGDIASIPKREVLAREWRRWLTQASEATGGEDTARQQGAIA